MDESRMKQHLQVLRRGGLLRPGRFSNLPDRLLTPSKDGEDAYARSVAERTGPRRDQVDLFV
jgi:hypothetical protein